MTSMLPAGEVADFMYEYSCKITRASDRCIQISSSEVIMGYEESANMYIELSDEILATRRWVSDILTKMIPSDL
jgi:hypothetical protein